MRDAKESLEVRLQQMEMALEDSSVAITTSLGGHTESLVVRLWHQEVRVDWEKDEQAGDCLVRPALVRRLLALGARVELDPSSARLEASPGAVAALSARHGRLALSLGRRLRLEMVLLFDGSGYTGGREVYIADGTSGKHGREILIITARVQPSKNVGT